MQIKKTIPRDQHTDHKGPKPITWRMSSSQAKLIIVNFSGSKSEFLIRKGGKSKFRGLLLKIMR